MNIIDTVDRLLNLEKKNDGATLLGIGPMSVNLIKASLEQAKEDNYPVMFIASRNQVDIDEFGSGYVNGWNQERFAMDIKKVASEVGYDGPYYLCRDHGGPYQRDEERESHLDLEIAMEKAKKSFKADLKAGFNLLMIDPTKDPFQVGKIIPMDKVLDLTVELIQYCENERKLMDLPKVAYEVGTEETYGGLTTIDRYSEFIERLEEMLNEKDLPMPTFIVGQTGTLTRKTEQIGEFNFENAKKLSMMAKKYNVGLKEHNGDYLDSISLLMHRPASVTAVNVAPQYGTVETRALIDLCTIENKLENKKILDNKSNLYSLMMNKAIESKKWKKWMTEDLTIDNIKSDKELSKEILEIAGHYTFNDPEVRKEINKLYNNLKQINIHGERFVIEQIKKHIKEYSVAFNLKNLNNRLIK